jgi:hypothetical protein
MGCERSRERRRLGKKLAHRVPADAGHRTASRLGRMYGGERPWPIGCRPINFEAAALDILIH